LILIILLIPKSHSIEKQAIGQNRNGLFRRHFRFDSAQRPLLRLTLRLPSRLR